MVAAIKKKLRESAAARWTVLVLVSVTMMSGYVISDVMAPLKTMLEQQLGWDSSEYGIFTSGYGIFNVFLFMLIIGGMILDRKGPRFTGVLAVIIMIAGTTLKYWAVSSDFGGAELAPAIGNWEVFRIKSQVFYSMLGFAIFGVGIELIGITASKIVVKWFSGHSLALAMGLNVAAGRIGTAIAAGGSLPVAKYFGHPGAPLVICLIGLCIGLLTFLIYVMLDIRVDKEDASIEKTKLEAPTEEENFRIADIFSIARIRGFWYITLLCLLFYSAVFPFLKYATELMIQKFNISTDWAGSILALIPIGNMLLTPLFGSIYDIKGKGATIMIIGACMLVAVHLLFAVPMLTGQWMAIVLMLVLGAAFSLVPSAMWPSVPKIVPYRMLGTAYSMVFWIQNIGLSGVPLLIGYILNKYCVSGEIIVDGMPTTAYDYTLPMLVFAGFGVLSVLFALLLKREDSLKQFGLQEPNIKK